VAAPGNPLRIATRGSTLARWQAADVARRLRLVRPDLQIELVLVVTTGDRRRELPVWELGGQAVFVKEVQAAVLEGRADVAVHSAKDLPSSTDSGLFLGAFPVRADPRDALVGSALADLAPGALVATGSIRRRAQLAWLRPDLTFTSIRGNIPTRLERVPNGGAVVVAAAALDRLARADQAAEILDVAVMLPQVGQGAIAVECRSGDTQTVGLLEQIDDANVRAEVTAERAFLSRLGGGCDLPVGARARFEVDGAVEGRLLIEGLLASPDGRVLLRSSADGWVGGGSVAGKLGGAGLAANVPAPASPADLGARLAGELLAAGGAELLDLGSAAGEADP
jgi:hydroxymethylbilane synthase